jgi:hypothetical protein
VDTDRPQRCIGERSQLKLIQFIIGHSKITRTAYAPASALKVKECGRIAADVPPCSMLLVYGQ